jgi:glycine/D-amino acid oxidase-like deaminating enzyme
VAWLLQNQGHPVCLIDPQLEGTQAEGAGSSAALGLLMAQVYRRSSGRGWRLRQQSLQLWHSWREQLAARPGHGLAWRPGLLQLARTPDELEALQRLAAERQARGLPLELLSRDALQQLQPELPAALGGLFSPEDGQLDPIPAMAALLADARRLGLECRSDAVLRLERSPAQARWRVALMGGETLACRWLVLTAGLGSPALLEPLGHRRPQTPVLGQALELQLPEQAADPLQWPGSISWAGINLVPRPGRRLWLGATLEPGTDPAAATLETLRQLNGAAPRWLLEAEVVRQWQGLRARPEGRPAPLLEQLEPGLLLASGHYRNGVLLAPATAAWVANQISLEP